MSTTSLQLPCVVIVDDDDDQLFLTLKLLAKAKLQNPILTMRSGSEIIGYLARCGENEEAAPCPLPGLVFLDLHMPRVDGFSVLNWIREQSALASLKVIVLSSSENPDDIERCSRLGAAGFITKRNSPAVLSYILNQTMATPGFGETEVGGDGASAHAASSLPSRIPPAEDV